MIDRETWGVVKTTLVGMPSTSSRGGGSLAPSGGEDSMPASEFGGATVSGAAAGGGGAGGKAPSLVPATIFRGMFFTVVAVTEDKEVTDSASQIVW